jgi:hypothetical protein
MTVSPPNSSLRRRHARAARRAGRHGKLKEECPRAFLDALEAFLQHVK